MIRKILLLLCAALLPAALIAIPACAATSYCETCGQETEYSINENDDGTHSYKCVDCKTVFKTESCSLSEWKGGPNGCIKTCGLCDYKLEKSHNLGAWKNHTAAFHIATCTDCGAKLSHSSDFSGSYIDGGENCVKKCVNCTITKTYTHSYSDWSSNGSTCVRKCENCQHEQSHSTSVSSWTSAGATQHTGTCATCGATVTAQHAYTLQHDATNHWYVCVCGATQGAAEAHTGTWSHSDGQCSRTCSVCSNTESHSWNVSGWTETTSGCQGTCTLCGETFVKPHNEGSAYDYRAEDGHARLCADCGAKVTAVAAHTLVYKSSDTEHWQECSVCGYATTHVAHSYTDYAEDGTQCTGTCVCGKTSSHTTLPSTWQPSADGSVCETTCQTCTRTLTKAHVPSDVLSSDENDHWYACTVCGGVTSEPTSHCYDAVNLNDGTHQMTCECGATLSAPEDHTYDWSILDDSTHIQECVCGARTGTAEAHTFAWEEIDGEHYYTCKICGYMDPAKTHGVGKGKSLNCALRSCNRNEKKHTHSYSDWIYGDEAVHKAACACGNSCLTVECVYVPFTLQDVVYEICPVCGNIRDVVLDEEGNIVESTDAEIIVTRVQNVKTVFAEETIDGDIDVLIDELADGTKLLSIGFDKAGTLVQAEEPEEADEEAQAEEEVPKTYTFTVELPEETLPGLAELISIDGEGAETVLATAGEDGSALFTLTLTEELDVRFVIREAEPVQG